MAGAGHSIQDGDPTGHFSHKILIYGLIYCYQIFFFMIIARAHDPVHQVSLIGQKQKTFGFLVKTSDGVNTDGVIQIFDYRRLLPLLLRTAHNATGFVK